MTALLDKAMASASALPPGVQDKIARIVLDLTGESQSVYQLNPEEEADLDEADAEIKREDFATDEQVRAIWAKYGL